VRKGGDETDSAVLRAQARRRLIGAAVLLLAVAIVVPLLLDPAPRPAADNIAVDIPSEKQPFTPRLAPPPVPDPAQQGPVEGGTGEADGKGADAVEKTAAAVPDKEKAGADKPKGERHVLQAAALSTEAAARELSDKLRKAGFATFIEKVETKDGVRYRVRVGPYSSRDEAQRAQSRLRAFGVSATLVAAG
jgi:DedD protein